MSLSDSVWQSLAAGRFGEWRLDRLVPLNLLRQSPHWCARTRKLFDRQRSLAQPQSQPATLKQVTTASPWLVSLVVHLAALLLFSVWLLPATPVGASLALLVSPAEVASSEPVGQISIEQAIASPLDASHDLSPVFAATELPQSPSQALAPVEVAVTELELSSNLSRRGLLGGVAMQHLNESVEGAQFFGVQARGRKFVFVVDSSNSMRRGKLDAAKQELLYAIRRLSTEQMFYVIFFNHVAVPMSLSGTGQPEPQPLPATNDNIARLAAWVETVGVDPWTDPSEAMRRAIEMQPDAIYLLSDGEFTDRGQTTRYLAAQNVVHDPVAGRQPKVVIHTVGLHQRGGERTLRNLARIYGGNYRFVPPE